MEIIIRLNDKDLKLLKDVEEITDVNYDIKGNTIEPSILLTAIEDLKILYENLHDDLKEYKEDIENDNFISNEGIDRETDYYKN